MTTSSIEHRTRASLPLLRFMQNVMPLSLSNRLLRIGTARVKLDSDVNHETVNSNGVRCEWIIPNNTGSEQVLLYLHGGGFVLGQTPLHLKMGSYLAQKLNFRVLMVDYRTAPQYPFPAALDDSETAYHWLIKQGVSPQNIVVAGDSAGGNLTIALLMKLRDEGNPLPTAAACLSPAADLTPEAHLNSTIKDPLLPPKAIKFYRQSYIAKGDPYNPLISPVLGNFENLPPLLIHVGEDEILREDATHLADAARSTGVDVRLEIYPRMWHVWQINLALPQASQSLDDIANFFKENLMMDSYKLKQKL